MIGTTKELTENLIDSIGLTWNDFDGVILVGGSTRMRMVHNYVKDMSGKEPLAGVNVDEAVALGAAIRANIDDKGQAVPMIGGPLSSKQNGPLLIQGAKAVSDVTAHSLGMISISADGERYVNSSIIKKNSKIPADNTRPFNLRTRKQDNELEVYVLQGEFERPLDNTIINKYVITDIKKTSPANSVINVTYQYTSNGVVEVSAVQTETNNKLPIRIEPVPEDMSWTDGSPKDLVGTDKMPSIEIILAIDLSGSMGGDPIAKAQQAMNDFVDQMDEGNTKIGIVAFADRAKCILTPNDNFNNVKANILCLTSVDVGGGTSAEPFTTALPLLKGKFLKKDDIIRYIIVLTDGQWFNPGPAIKAAKKCHKEGIEIMALGFGTADYQFLKQIASTDEFASVTSLSELSGSFSKIAQAIGEF